MPEPQAGHYCHAYLHAVCRVKCKKYDQQSSIEETLRELERPAADDSEQSGAEQDNPSALIQRTPSAVRAGHLHHYRIPMLPSKLTLYDPMLFCPPGRNAGVICPEMQATFTEEGPGNALHIDIMILTAACCIWPCACALAG